MESNYNGDYQILLLKKEDLSIKESYYKTVYELLETAYSSCGGINSGSGFKDPNDMLMNIPFWRLTIKFGRIISVMMFKEKRHGLKMVAYAPLTDIDLSIRSSDIEFMMNNSYVELSGALLVVVLKYLGANWKQYIQSSINDIIEKESELLMDFLSTNKIPLDSELIYKRLRNDWPELLSFCYLRIIGNEKKLKVILGSVNVKKVGYGKCL